MLAETARSGLLPRGAWGQRTTLKTAASLKLVRMRLVQSAVALLHCGGLVGCAQPAPCAGAATPMRSADRPFHYASKRTYLEYFPRALFEKGAVAEYEAEWWVGKLLDFSEPPLVSRGVEAHSRVYRILNIPSLAATGDWVIVAQGNADGGRLTLKQSVVCRDDARVANAITTTKKEKAVDRATWQGIDSCMRLFWTAPARDSVHGTDGTTTVIEGVRSGSYHLISRWSLSRTDPDSGRRALAECLERVTHAMGDDELALARCRQFSSRTASIEL